MASSTSDLIVRLSLDTTNFEGSPSKFEGQMTKLQTSCIVSICRKRAGRSNEQRRRFLTGHEYFSCLNLA